MRVRYRIEKKFLKKKLFLNLGIENAKRNKIFRTLSMDQLDGRQILDVRDTINRRKQESHASRMVVV